MGFTLSAIGDAILDIRDIIEYLESLDEDNLETKTQVLAILEELKGCGGDEKYEGEWYPLLLIADRYFETYARELAEDIGLVSSNLEWPLRFIDWEQAAIELQIDYASIDLVSPTGKTTTYWYR